MPAKKKRHRKAPAPSRLEVFTVALAVFSSLIALARLLLDLLQSN